MWSLSLLWWVELFWSHSHGERGHCCGKSKVFAGGGESRRRLDGAQSLLAPFPEIRLPRVNSQLRVPCQHLPYRLRDPLGRSRSGSFPRISIKSRGSYSSSLDVQREGRGSSLQMSRECRRNRNAATVAIPLSGGSSSGPPGLVGFVVLVVFAVAGDAAAVTAHLALRAGP